MCAVSLQGVGHNRLPRRSVDVHHCRHHPGGVVMMLIKTKKSVKLRGRLVNWKFKQALQYLRGQPENVNMGVRTLDRLFGDCGWGLDGEMGQLVELAVTAIIGEERPS